MGIEEVLRLLRNKLASLEYSKQQAETFGDIEKVIVIGGEIEDTQKAIETIKKGLDVLK